jgi:hypothetical protein
MRYDNVLLGQVYRTPRAAVIDDMKQLWNDDIRVITKNLEKNLLHCFFVHHES